MNPSTLTQLQIIVERAVRPVWASRSRKHKMREELLAHVTAAFDEESGGPGDERLALERTERRFGNPAELTVQLQESVPPSDRWVLFLERIFDGSGVSTPRLALRYALYSLVPGAALITAFFIQDRMAEWPIVPVLAALTFASVVLGGKMYDALFGPTGRSWPKAVLTGFASCLLMPAAVFTLCMIFTGDWRTNLTNLVPMLPLALLTPAAMAIPAPLFAAEARVQREWANLSID